MDPPFCFGAWRGHLLPLLLGPHVKALQMLGRLVPDWHRKSRAEGVTHSLLCSTRLGSLALFIACCSTEQRHPGKEGSLLPPASFVLLLLLLEWLLRGAAALLVLAHFTGLCTFLVLWLSMSWLSSSLTSFPCHAEHAASLAEALQSCPCSLGRAELPSSSSAEPMDRKPLLMEAVSWQGKAAALWCPRGDGLKQTNTSWHLSRSGWPGRLMGSRWQGWGPA